MAENSKSSLEHSSSRSLAENAFKKILLYLRAVLNGQKPHELKFAVSLQIGECYETLRNLWKRWKNLLPLSLNERKLNRSAFSRSIAGLSWASGNPNCKEFPERNRGFSKLEDLKRGTQPAKKRRETSGNIPSELVSVCDSSKSARVTGQAFFLN